MLAFETIHEFYRKQNFSEHRHRVIEAGIRFNMKSNEILNMEKNFIYYVDTGVMSIAVDDDERIIGTTIEYMPIGLLERFCPIAQFRYSALTLTSMIKISQQEFDRIFFGNTKEYMQELAAILSYMLIFILDVHVERRTDSGYHTIKAMLHRYMYRRSVNSFEREGIANFIIRRTNLSRSYVFRVLAELKEGQYITIQKGKLIAINRKLPNDF
ncbi:helix-turn-helix domain-containing protein [Klebsiella aerogenes]